MHLLVAPDDPPVGHQNIPQDIPQENTEQVDPAVSDTSVPGRAKCVPPIKISLRPGEKYPWKRQYLLKPEALGAIQPLLSRFLKHGLIRPCQFPCNSPILHVQRPNGEYRLLQDLQAANEAVIPVHTLVPNPYTLLVQVPGKSQYFFVLDLKDVFFCIPLHPDSQYLFAFEWRDADTLEATRYTWTTLPQGFRDSPHLFRNALARELRELSLEKGTLLQYVDDLLISSETKQDSDQNSVRVLNFLAKRGYKVSPNKAQISQQWVPYLGFVLTPGT